jgi:hypothetical protein
VHFVDENESVVHTGYVCTNDPFLKQMRVWTSLDESADTILVAYGNLRPKPIAVQEPRLGCKRKLQETNACEEVEEVETCKKTRVKTMEGGPDKFIIPQTDGK